MENRKTTNVLIVGVGGQGIILASEVLALVCLAAGYDVKQSEVHGMAQRGGSVTSHIRFGPKVHSPTIERGRTDVLLSFELLEGRRWFDYLSPTGIAIVNSLRIDPMPVASGKEKYPDNIEAELRAKCHHLDLVDGLRLAQKAGNTRSVNVVLLGALSRYLEFDISLWRQAIADRVPQKTIDINLRAFNFGRQIVPHSSETA